jgi:serine protease Do
MNGEVVGITTAKYSGNSGSGATIEGIGFAIPIDDVKDMLDDLTNYGYIRSAYLGISVSDMDPQAAAYYNLPSGAYVQEVVPGNCAHAAGMQVKDIIIAVGEYEVTGVNSLSKALRQFQAGDVTTVTVYRGGKEIVLDITLDEKPAEVPETVPVTPQVPESQIPESNDFEDWYEFFRDYFGNGGK